MAAAFTKTLTLTDVTKRMAVPQHMMQHLPEIEGETISLTVEDVHGKQKYGFGFSIRTEGHPKPVFLGGWLEFVRQKGLSTGDRVAFWLDRNAAGGPRYKIAAERRIILLGIEIYGAV